MAAVARVSLLRRLLASRGLDAYVVPSEDAHQSEYIAACDTRRQFITGFSGSFGFAVVTAAHAAMWTDGRYFLQAESKRERERERALKHGAVAQGEGRRRRENGFA